MRTEILSPCGGPDSLEAAIRAGCDGVYAGSEKFSARSGAKNFTPQQLEEAVKVCHLHGVKFYQAINTIVFDSELEALRQEIAFACRVGVDGLIVQDLAAVKLVRDCCPQMKLHASTQMTIHTPLGVEFARKLGFSRVVAARELDLGQLEELCRADGAEIEVFVHGALCMCVSGQCYLSAMIGSRSANRGKCAQPCRLPFDNGLNDHCLSLKDLGGAEHIPALCQMGAASLKIEGRMKRPEYVAAATDVCRKARDGEPYRTDLLTAVFSRSGLTDGYLTGKRRDMFGIRRKEDVAAAAQALPRLHELYRRERKSAQVSFFLCAKSGKPLTLSAEDDTGCVANAVGAIPEKALNRPTDREFCEKQLSKLGDTIYQLKNTDIQIDQGLAVSAKELNSLRREVCRQLDCLRIKKNTPVLPFEDKAVSAPLRTEKHGRLEKRLRRLRLKLSSVRQLEGALADGTDRLDCVILPADQALKLDWTDKSQVGVSLPRFVTDEKKLEQTVSQLREKGFSKGFASNYAHIEMLKKYGFEVHGEIGLNVANSCALELLGELGLASATLSPELKIPQINGIIPYIKTSVAAAGRLPLMLCRNCPIGDCAHCKGQITDRTGRVFPVACSKEQGYTELLNSDILWLGDRQDSIEADYFLLLFSEETPSQVRETVSLFLKGERPSGKLTRGLYYRGVL